MTTDEIIEIALDLPKDEQKKIAEALRLGKKATPADPLVQACYEAAQAVLGVPVGYNRRDRLQVMARTFAAHTLRAENYTIQQIAAALGVNRSNVYAHFQRLDYWVRYGFYHQELEQLRQYEQQLKTTKIWQQKHPN